MGISHSAVGGVEESATVEKKEVSNMVPEERLEMEDNARASDKFRFVELMQAIQRIAGLQREAARAQVEARQKMREVGFKREEVWICDAAFMREVQRFMAEEPLEKFAELRRLGAECQAARDGLGPVEQEGIEAEQRWEGHGWKLRKTAEGLYDEFKDEFELAASYPPPPMSDPSTQYGSYSDPESNRGEDVNDAEEHLPFRPSDSVVSSSSLQLGPSGDEMHATLDIDTSQVLLGLAYVPPNDHYLSDWDSDSGIGEIDRAPDSWNSNDLVGPPQDLPLRHDATTERYPELSTNFSTKRTRINKWLLQMMLLSHFEADLLVAQLDSENEKRPSNWSQLVIAYWELDAAAIPHGQQLPALQGADSPPNPNYQPEGTKHESTMHSSSPTDTTTLALKPTLTLKPFASRGSSNADLGYVSDFTSKSRDSLHSLTMAIQPRRLPPGFYRHSDVGQKTAHNEPNEQQPP